MAVQNVNAQKGSKKGPFRASKYSYLPSGYSQVGTTRLYYKQNSDAIDMIGYYNGYYYSSTYSDYGYKLSVQVGTNSAIRVDCLNGTTSGGVTVQPSVEQQGELARICYTVTNANETDVVISMGVHADVMIGNNDSAPIERRIDTFGQTYGLTMKDGYGAQLCVLFGSGLAGVTAVSDFWFGHWSDNSEAYNMVGNYYTAGNWMVENGNYDSGMGWCWKERTITAGSTVVFSYVIGVGEVNLEPNSTFEVTPDDPEGWNDLSRPHRLTLNGLYESPAGLDGVIDYAVEDSENWIALTDTLASGDEFMGSLVAMFDATKSTHVIRFRTRDLVGNTTMLHPIEYKDVSFYALTGIEEKTYTGDSLYQTNITCGLNDEHYVLKNYHNNVNAGTASFNFEGVFPYTIGRKTYTFNIVPQTLAGELVLAETDFVYNGSYFMPDWQFSNESYTDLEDDKDYTLLWNNNRLPGTATLTATGKGNYTGTLTANFTIDKAQLQNNLFTLILPDEDITYDEQSHGAAINIANGVGQPTITYLKQGETEASTNQPTAAGDYAIYLTFADGSLYYGRENSQVGSFTIYEFSSDEWDVLQAVLPQLTEMGWSQPWDVSQGMKGVSSLQGLTIEKGHVTGLNLSGQNLTGAFPAFVLDLPQLQSLNLADNHLYGDIDKHMDIYLQEKPTETFAIMALNISGNQLSGNIGAFAQPLTNLVSLNAAANCIETVSPMISPNVTDLFLGYQVSNDTLEVNLSNLSGGELLKIIPNIATYNHESQIYSTSLRMDWYGGDNFYIGYDIEDGILSQPQVGVNGIYRGQNGDTFETYCYRNENWEQCILYNIKLFFSPGDTNFDGIVDVLDLQRSINHIFEYGNIMYATPFNFTAANLWEDEIINVQDVVKLVTLLINTEVDEEEEADGARVTEASAMENAEATVYCRNGQLFINTSRPVATFDITLRSSESVNVLKSLEQAGFTCAVRHDKGSTRIIGYSMKGATLPVGETVIARTTGNTKVIRSVMADSQAQRITVALDDQTTGIAPAVRQSSDERYRLSVGRNGSIVIDRYGNKTFQKKQNQ